MNAHLNRMCPPTFLLWNKLLQPQAGCFPEVVFLGRPVPVVITGVLFRNNVPIISFQPHSKAVGQVFLSPFSRGEEGGSERRG